MIDCSNPWGPVPLEEVFDGTERERQVKIMAFHSFGQDAYYFAAIKANIDAGMSEKEATLHTLMTRAEDILPGALVPTDGNVLAKMEKELAARRRDIEREKVKWSENTKESGW